MFGGRISSLVRGGQVLRIIVQKQLYALSWAKLDHILWGEHFLSFRSDTLRRLGMNSLTEFANEQMAFLLA